MEKISWYAKDLCSNSNAGRKRFNLLNRKLILKQRSYLSMDQIIQKQIKKSISIKQSRRLLEPRISMRRIQSTQNKECQGRLTLKITLTLIFRQFQKMPGCLKMVLDSQLVLISMTNPNKKRKMTTMLNQYKMQARTTRPTRQIRKPVTDDLNLFLHLYNSYFFLKIR